MNTTELAGKSRKCNRGKFWTDFGEGGLGGDQGVLRGAAERRRAAMELPPVSN